jgi:phage-related protein
MPYVEVKDEELIYDRTRNFSGIADFQEVSQISCPTEGSSVEFKAKDKAITSNNNYLNIMPVGINNVYAEYNMVYEVDEVEAQKLANFLESKRGVEPVFFETDPTVYKKINGYCTNYSINQIDVETFSLSASFEVTESPGHLNWTGMNFLNPEDLTVFYVGTNKQYKKNDVV